MTLSRPRRALLLLALFAANILVALSLGYSLVRSRQHYEQKADLLTQNITNALDQGVSSSIQKIDLILSVVVDEMERQQAGNSVDDATNNAFLARQRAKLPEIESLRVASAEGIIILGNETNRKDRISIADRDYFATLRDNPAAGLIVTKPLFGKISNHYVILFARRFNDRNGHFAGVTYSTIATDHFYAILSQYDVGVHGTVTLRDADLGLIARLPKILGDPNGQVGGKGTSREIRELLDTGALSGTYHSARTPDQIERTYSFHRLKDAPILAFVGVASMDYLADWYDELRKSCAIGLGFMILSLLSGGKLFRLLQQAEDREERLQQSEAKLRNLFELAPVGIVLTNMAGRFLEFNEAFLRITGYTESELKALDPWQLTPRKYAADEASLLASLENAGRYGPFAKEYVRKDGSVVQILQNGVIVSGQGNDRYVWSIVEDITERLKSENDLIQARFVAESANLAKSRFLATMSHEIRTPMNGILGMAQLLKSADISDEERQEFVQVILNSGQTLQTLLNDILDLSKIEADKLELESIVFAPASLLHEAQSLFGKAAADKGLRLQIRGVADASDRYKGDPNRLQQMLSNLVSNAIKFTEQGDISIEFREIKRKDGIATLEFAVSDTGVGIAADKHAILFTPFTQADSSTTRQHGGTGLGLSIVRYLAERMGGMAGFDSALGQGSRFWFRICAETVSEQSAACDEPAALLPEPQRTRQRRILVVEDNATNRAVITAMLKRMGFGFETAVNGQEALSRVKTGKGDDLVLMDCQMPIMDGIEATLRIRQWEQENDRNRIPIIALTAGAFEEDRQRCLTAGMDDFLTKPLVFGDLRKTLETWIGDA